jgi:hypothetical protein
MLRLPSDVAQALRRRAATADISIAEAARQLMLPQDVRRDLSLLDHAAWLHGRMARRRDDLVEVFRLDRSDPKAVDRAIEALAGLIRAWPQEDDTDDTTDTHGIVHP